MERIEADLTVGEEWQNTLNATCNRLSTQYLNLLKAAAAAGIDQGHQQHQGDPRGTFLKCCVFLFYSVLLFTSTLLLFYHLFFQLVGVK